MVVGVGNDRALLETPKETEIKGSFFILIQQYFFSTKLPSKMKWAPSKMTAS